MLKRILVVGIISFLIFLFLRHAASILVRNAPVKADVILVLGGGDNDTRYWRAVELLQEEYGRLIVLDVPTRIKYGRQDTELAADFVSRTLPGRAVVCPIKNDSTFEEASLVALCLERLHPTSVLLVTSDYHTRRAFSILRKTLPQYQWSVAAAADPPHFGTRWWTNRPWAKTLLQEWERLIWWNLVDRWR